MKIASAVLCLLVLVSGAVARDVQDVFRLYGLERLSEAEALCDSLLGVSPDDQTLIHAKGRIRTDLYDFATAVPFLERGLADGVPGWIPGWSHLYLGICALNLGDSDAARDHWEAVVPGTATDSAVATATAYRHSLFGSGPFADWPLHRSEHYEVLVSPSLTETDIETFIDSRKFAHAYISHWCGAEADRPIRLVLWSSQEEARIAGMKPPGYNRAVISLAHEHVAQTAGHETAHVISLRTLRPSRICGLIGEGLAVFLDMTSRDKLAEARAAVRTRGGTVDIVELWNDWSSLPPETSYAVAGAFVERLVARGGRERFLELFRDQGIDTARWIYGDDLEAWTAEFEADLSR